MPVVDPNAPINPFTVLALVVALFSPFILSILTGNQRRNEKRDDNIAITKLEDQRAKIRRAEKEEDWARQDKVAKQAAEAARLLLEEQKKTNQKTDEVARLASISGSRIDSKLDQIHTLVNSEMTAARQELLDSTRLSIVAMKRTIAADEKNGIVPSETDLLLLRAAESRVTELEQILADRLIQQRRVDQQQRDQAALVNLQAGKEDKQGLKDTITDAITGAVENMNVTAENVTVTHTDKTDEGEADGKEKE